MLCTSLSGPSAASSTGSISTYAEERHSPWPAFATLKWLYYRRAKMSPKKLNSTTKKDRGTPITGYNKKSRATTTRHGIWYSGQRRRRRSRREKQGEHQGFAPTSSATARSSQQVPATTAVSTSIIWSMGSDIENAEEIKAWHQNIWMLFNYLFLRIAGVATSFLLRYKPKSGEIPNGKAAWDCMIA